MTLSTVPSSRRAQAPPAVVRFAPRVGLPTRYGRTALIALIGVGLAVRLTCFAAAYHNGGGLPAAHGANTSMYVQPAESLLSTGRFAVDGTPELLRTPGYPIFLMPSLIAGDLEIITITLQLLLSVATIWLVYDITLTWTGQQLAALGAAFLMTIEPISIIFSYMLMTETLFTFLMVLAVRQLLCYFATQSLAALTQTALLLAMATMVRPVSYYLPTILAALLVAQGLWSSERRMRAACHAALFWAVSMAPLFAWQVRNYAETGYSGFAAIADFNLYFFHAASVLAHERSLPIETIQSEIGFTSRDTFDQLHPELDPDDQVARFHFLHAEGARVIRQHPWTFAKTYLRGLAILTFNPGASEVLASLHCYPADRPLRAANLSLLGRARQMQATAPQLFYLNLVLLIALATTYLTAALGLVSQLRRLSWQLVALATVALYFLAVSGGATCLTRLRHPVMPLVIVLSGIGIGQLAAWWHRSRTGRQSTTNTGTEFAQRVAA